jgi:2-oxoglutarate ferredoxin oxidoreductase subunit gamma
LDPEQLGRRGLETMKYYQKVGRTAHNTHPKDAGVQVNEKGEIIEIVEGDFLVEANPSLKEALDGRIAFAERVWRAEKQTLDNRLQLTIRKEHLPRTEVQLGGFGGQGIISAGRIIGLAAAIYDGLEACFTQSYGPEARGGAAGSQVILASNPIHHPHLIQPTSMIIMSQGAYSKYVPTLAKNGLLLIDDSLVNLAPEHREDIKTYGISATQIAEEAGNKRAANTVMLGFWAAITGIVSQEAMRQAVAESVPGKAVDLNMKVFEIGYGKGLEQRTSK